MIELDNLTNYKKGRLWISDLPVINYKTVKTLKETFKATLYGCQEKNIALELVLPRNSSNYALLGANYIPDDSGFLKVEVQISGLDKDEFKENTASTVDKVFCGIPKEYGEAVIGYISNNANDIEIPSGKLAFKMGAYGLIGSSNAVFSLITKVIMRMIVYNLKDKEIVEIKNFISNSM